MDDFTTLKDIKIGVNISYPQSATFYSSER